MIASVDVDRLSWDFRFPVTALPGSSGSRPAKTSPICRGCTTCAVEKVGLVVKTNEPEIAVLSQYCTDMPKWMFHVYLFCLHVFTLVYCLLALKSFTYTHIIHMCTVFRYILYIISTSMYVYGNIHIYIYVYIIVYIYTYVHTHLDTYIYICIYRVCVKYVFICLYICIYI